MFVARDSFVTSAGSRRIAITGAINLSSKTSHINIDQESCLVMASIPNVSQF